MGLKSKALNAALTIIFIVFPGRGAAVKRFIVARYSIPGKGRHFSGCVGIGFRLMNVSEWGGLIMNYIFKTTATMKEYNNKKWYIDGGIVSDMRINADSVENALEIYRERVEEKHFINISKNAIKNKSEMFADLSDGSVKQVGYVITGKTEFDRGDYSGYSTQYIAFVISR